MTGPQTLPPSHGPEAPVGPSQFSTQCVEFSNGWEKEDEIVRAEGERRRKREP